MTVATFTPDTVTFYGYSQFRSEGSVAPAMFTYRTATILVGNLFYSTDSLQFGISPGGGTVPADGLLGAGNFSLEFGTGGTKISIPINNPGTGTSFTLSNQGLSWSAGDPIPVKLLRINNAPTVATVIPDQTATAGTAFSYAFPATTFSNADGDTLIYTATKADGTALPTWLSGPATQPRLTRRAPLNP